MYGLIINEDECMVMVLKGDHGIVRYGNECMKLEIMV